MGPCRVVGVYTLLLGITTLTDTLDTISVVPLGGVEGAEGVEDAEDRSVVRVSGVAGGEVQLPCDTRPPTPNDSLLLVVWYRDDLPIYSFDARASSATAYWAEDALVGRARWAPAPPSALRLGALGARDAAAYRCRVDYRLSPTRNYNIVLEVVEMPSKPFITDEAGTQLGDTAGPFLEGGEIKLVCVVKGGVPAPRVRWLRAGGDTSDSSAGEGATLAEVGAGQGGADAGVSRALTLLLRNATRRDHGAIFVCAADNTPLVPPLATSVRTQLYLRPLSVRIEEPEQPLSAGQMATLTCSSRGARPPPDLTWWLDGNQLPSTHQQQTGAEGAGGAEGEGEGEESRSQLVWKPRMEHNGHTLTCRATHAHFPHHTIEHTIGLDVHFPPTATLKLGSKTNPHDVEEGDPVTLECLVRANPPAYKVIWEHNDEVVRERASVAVRGGGGAAQLSVAHVTRSDAGRYACVASNVEGDGRSQELTLRVLYKPVCKRREVAQVGLALHEVARVLCEVDAYPAPDTFTWTLNTSAGSVPIDPARVEVQGPNGRSTLTYTPVSEDDYGTVTCAASNMAGHQQEPCVFMLLPAARPEPPANCTTYNLSEDSVDVQCAAGHEGGLPCVYVAEAWAGGALAANASGAAPSWQLRPLPSGTPLRLLFYAANARGRSDHVQLEIQTPHTIPSVQEAHSWEMGWAVGGLAGGVLTVLVILLLALIATRVRRHRSRDYDVRLEGGKSGGGKGKSATKSRPLSFRPSPLGQDDNNPDVVPLNKDSIERGPDPPPYGALDDLGPNSHKPLSPLAPPASHASLPPLAPLTALSALPPLAPPQQPTKLESYTPHSLTPSDDSKSEGSKVTSSSSSTGRPRRDVVTTRTPLLSSGQESCV